MQECSRFSHTLLKKKKVGSVAKAAKALYTYAYPRVKVLSLHASTAWHATFAMLVEGTDIAIDVILSVLVSAVQDKGLRHVVNRFTEELFQIGAGGGNVVLVARPSARE
jgi:hypothetical protein